MNDSYPENEYSKENNDNLIDDKSEKLGVGKSGDQTYKIDKLAENAIIDVIKDLGLDQKGYRLVTNNGRDANQEVPHFHIHILAGENLKGIR